MTAEDVLSLFQSHDLHISDGVDSCSGEDHEAMRVAAEEFAEQFAKLSREITSLREAIKHQSYIVEAGATLHVHGVPTIGILVVHGTAYIGSQTDAQQEGHVSLP